VSNLFDLSGRIALVTGANTGLGQAIAVALASAGADIVAVGRTRPEQTASQVRAVGRKLHAIDCDLGARPDTRAIVKEAVAKGGRLDILVNNAGIIRRNDALELTEEDWDAVLDLNLKTVFFLSQAAAHAMLAGPGRGKIINIASAGLTRILANEWASRGINVNAIAPGYFETNNTTALRADVERSADILKRIPAGRWGKPQDLAGAAVFLAASASDYVHGTILPVDGGWLAR
jgi:2-deoxy-D-gluconate 3-dehydrogenase